MSNLYAENESIPSACGVGHIYSFSQGDKPAWYWGTNINDLKNDGGADWTMAAFVPTDVCKAMYKALCAKHRLVFQSPVRENKNSGQEFFFCIFDTKGTMPYADEYPDDDDLVDEPLPSNMAEIAIPPFYPALCSH